MVGGQGSDVHSPLGITPLASAGAGQVVKEEMPMTSQGLSVTYGPGCLLLAQRYWVKRKHLTVTLLSGMDWRCRADSDTTPGPIILSQEETWAFPPY